MEVSFDLKLDTRKIRLWVIVALMFIVLLHAKVNVASSTGVTQQDLLMSNPLSVILMIGDGMGFEQVKLTRWIEVSPVSTLNMETLTVQGEVKTNSLNNAITDSAAAATAMATSMKTNNGMLSILPNGTILKTILEKAKEIGKSTGVITTTEVTHATPAAFYSHVDDRNSYSEIARQLVEEADIDVIMGGGKSRFSSSQLLSMESKGYTIVETKDQLLQVSSDRMLGLFSSGALPYERDRNRNMTPSLAEMTKKGLEILSQDIDGFFLMVEGGQIDWAGHANNQENVVLETVEFDRAVAESMEYVKTHSNTILIVTADHETGGLTVISNDFKTPLPSSNNTDEENESLRIDRANEVTLTWSTGSHTGVNVPFFMSGKNLVSYNATTLDNTEIYQIMYDHFYSDKGSPLIRIESPLNISYSTASDVLLKVAINETVNWVRYSLNNKPNVTLDDWEVSLNLTVGSYYLRVFAQDSFGNIGSNEVFFTVEGDQSTTTVSKTTSQATIVTTSTNVASFLFVLTIATLTIVPIFRKTSR